MIDSGATALFLDKKYADCHKMWQIPLENPITLYNIDGSLNEAGSITHKVKLSLRIGEDEEMFDIFITSLGPEKVILCYELTPIFFSFTFLTSFPSCDSHVITL